MHNEYHYAYVTMSVFAATETRQVATVILTVHIAAEHRSFNRICKVVPICTHLINGSLGPFKSATNSISIGSAVFAG